MAGNPFRSNPGRAWSKDIADLRRRRDPLDHALADQMEACPDNPANGGDGQGPARHPTVERQAQERREGSG
jgi:hypothetical protein